jgi:hypothetical protein
MGPILLLLLLLLLLLRCWLAARSIFSRPSSTHLILHLPLHLHFHLHLHFVFSIEILLFAELPGSNREKTIHANIQTGMHEHNMIHKEQNQFTEVLMPRDQQCAVA